jgi:hypothetical protein
VPRDRGRMGEALGDLRRRRDGDKTRSACRIGARSLLRVFEASALLSLAKCNLRAVQEHASTSRCCGLVHQLGRDVGIFRRHAADRTTVLKKARKGVTHSHPDEERVGRDHGDATP